MMRNNGPKNISDTISLPTRKLFTLQISSSEWFEWRSQLTNQRYRFVSFQCQQLTSSQRKSCVFRCKFFGNRKCNTCTVFVYILIYWFTCGRNFSPQAPHHMQSQTVVTFKFKGYKESNLLELLCMNKKGLKAALPFHETRILKTLENFLHLKLLTGRKEKTTDQLRAQNFTAGHFND